MKNILVIDDNACVLHSIEQYLRLCLSDCRVFSASNGSEAEEVMKNTAVDLVLTDLDMPVMDGFTFIDRARKAHPSLPICVMTGSRLAGLEEDLQARGVARCFEKPFPFDELINLISRELSREDRKTATKPATPVAAPAFSGA